MTKGKIPIYSICNLMGANQCVSEFLVTTIKDFLASHQGIIFPHRHSFYQLVYFTKSGGNHSIDFYKYSVVEGQAYYMSPGQIHAWHFDENTDGIIVNFNDSFFASVCHNPNYIQEFPIFKVLSGNPVTQLEGEIKNEIFGLFQKLLAEYNVDFDHKQDMLRAILTELLVRLSRNYMPNYQRDASKHHYAILFQFEKLIDSHFIYKKLPKEYAEMLFITPNHLNAVVNATIGKSAGELIRERILLEAKRLLINSNQSIYEIADYLQFEDNAYFSRFFKKYSGMSPEEFRRSISLVI